MIFGTRSPRKPTFGSVGRAAALALFLGLLTTAGCGGGGGDDGNTNPTQTATVTGRVVDSQTGNGIANATVTYGSATTLTGPTGDFSFSVSAPATSKSLKVSATDYLALGQYNGVVFSISGTGLTIPSLTTNQTVDYRPIKLYSSSGPPPPPSL